MANPILRSDQLWLYRTADLNINFTVSFDPVDRFQHVRGHFGVVFHGQSNGEVQVKTKDKAKAKIVTNKKKNK